MGLRNDLFTRMRAARELVFVLARVSLWLLCFAALLFGLFTFPILMVVGFTLVYIVVRNVRQPSA